MIRPFAVSFAAGLVLATAAASGVGESFPAVHNDPITIRILGGKDGQPLGRLHLVLIGGYDPHDMREQIYRDEVLTDAQGQVRLSNQLANLPWLQVWVGKKSLCQLHPGSSGFSVELIRRDGLSTPNRCGKAMVTAKPGVFTVFVKGKGVAPSSGAVASEPDPAPEAAPESSAPSFCTSSKKVRRAGFACGRLVFLLPGMALYLH